MLEEASSSGLLGFYMGESFVPVDCKGVLWTESEQPVQALPLFLNGEIGAAIELAPEDIVSWEPSARDELATTRANDRSWYENTGIVGGSRWRGDAIVPVAAAAIVRRRRG